MCYGANADAPEPPPVTSIHTATQTDAQETAVKQSPTSSEGSFDDSVISV